VPDEHDQPSCGNLSDDLVNVTCKGDQLVQTRLVLQPGEGDRYRDVSVLPEVAGEWFVPPAGR